MLAWTFGKNGLDLLRADVVQVRPCNEAKCNAGIASRKEGISFRRGICRIFRRPGAQNIMRVLNYEIERDNAAFADIVRGRRDKQSDGEPKAVEDTGRLSGRLRLELCQAARQAPRNGFTVAFSALQNSVRSFPGVSFSYNVHVFVCGNSVGFFFFF